MAKFKKPGGSTLIPGSFDNIKGKSAGPGRGESHARMCSLKPRDAAKSHCDGPRGPDLDFPLARSLARQRAGEVSVVPMLLAWFDRTRGRFSPNITCCREDKPSWLTYAESRGGDIVISINDLDYVFVFRGFSD